MSVTMHRMLVRTLMVLGIWLMGLSASAQGVRTVNGRKFMVHTVQAGQTLYAISRSFAVPVEDLLAANPASAFGLTIGQELLVPLDAVQKKELKTAPMLRTDGELLHTVRKKETLYGIAKAYGLELNQLLERNPEAINLNEGMTLVIPVEKVKGPRDAALAPAIPDGVVLHRVQLGETLFSLTKQYGVEEAAIRAANGGLPEGLKAGDNVRIPSAVVTVDTLSMVDDHRKERYKVAFLLPFSADQNDSAMARAGVNEVPRYYEPTRIAIQFYDGALLAIDSLKSLGLNADINVLDVGDNAGTWGPILKDPTLLENDLCIGPFHRSAIEALTRARVKAHIVCPVPQSSKVILGQPQVSKITPTRSDMILQTARYVAHAHAQDNIILLRPSIATETDLQTQMERALNNALAKQTGLYRDSVVVARPGAKDITSLTAKLDASKLNVVVVPSEDLEFVTRLVVKLKPFADKNRIVLVGMESWTRFEAIAAQDLDLLGYTFAATAFTDRNNPKVQAFAKRFREAYSSEPDEYAYLGFDVTFYFLKALMTQGPSFANHFDLVHTEPLHMGFRMTSTGPENGYRNEHAVMLQQKDLELREVR